MPYTKHLPMKGALPLRRLTFLLTLLCCLLLTLAALAADFAVTDYLYAADGWWWATADIPAEGTLTLLLDSGETLAEKTVLPGPVTLTWDTTANGSALPYGERELLLRFTDTSGSVCEESITVLIDTPTAMHDLTPMSPVEMYGTSCTHEDCAWSLRMGEMDTAKVWKALTAPITVIDGNERQQYRVRKEPSADCKRYAGEVTYASQGVHVLEWGEEWSLIEAYSTSVEGSSVKVYAEHFTGYVETQLLREREVSQKMGIVVDKQKQRLYLYRDGKLYSTLLCSTGYARNDTPFNETPAGEYICISWTGGFWSGNLFCDNAIRINDGILLHEVPCTISTNEAGEEVRSYDKCESYLGEKASHGCIRIQKEIGVNNVNEKWLWDHLPRPKEGACKVIIWDDKDRTLVPASSNYQVYYNPDNGRNYHSVPNCPLVNERFYPLTAITYQELEEDFPKLRVCPGCCPEPRREVIDRINEKNKR